MGGVQPGPGGNEAPAGDCGPGSGYSMVGLGQVEGGGREAVGSSGGDGVVVSRGPG